MTCQGWEGAQNEVLWKVTPANVANAGSEGGAEAQNVGSDEADLDSPPGSRCQGPTSRWGTRESRFLANEERPGLPPSNLWMSH